MILTISDLLFYCYCTGIRLTCTVSTALDIVDHAILLNPFPPCGRQSKITKGMVLASLGEKRLRKKDGQIYVQ